MRKSWKQEHASSCKFFIYSRRNHYSCSTPFLHVLWRASCTRSFAFQALLLAPVKSTRILFISTKSSSVTYFVVYAPLAWNFKLSHLSFPSHGFLLPALRSPLTLEIDDHDREQWPWNHLYTISSLLFSISSLNLTDHSTICNLNNITFSRQGQNIIKFSVRTWNTLNQFLQSDCSPPKPYKGDFHLSIIVFQDPPRIPFKLCLQHKDCGNSKFYFCISPTNYLQRL